MNTVTFSIGCQFCKKDTTLELSAAGLIAYRNGALIQDAFPDLSADDREMLISRTCAECWEKMFG